MKKIIYKGKTLSNCYVKEVENKKICISYRETIAVYYVSKHVLKIQNPTRLTETSKKHLAAFLLNFISKHTGTYTLIVEN